MITQAIFHPSDIAGADGWTELGGGTQPPNRALPAPIFDNATSVFPNNGNTGTWIIEKIVGSDIPGPGFLTIPAGSFPSGGALYADDQVLSVTVNGVSVPFTGLGTGVIPAQTQPVTWIGGANLVRITVNNTVAGGTSLAGRLVASGPGMPCDCCPSGPARCATTGVIFDGAHTLVFQGGPGVTGSSTPPALQAWSDGAVAGSLFTGFNTPNVQLTAATSPVVDLEFVSPQNRITGLREWNQGGGDLNDSDGFSSWDYEFFAGATSLLTGNMVMGNGGAPFTHIFPGGQVLNGVTRVRLSNMRKVNPGATVAPLVREVQAIQTIPAFPCRRPSGAVEWYTASGDPVPSAEVVDCAPGAQSCWMTVPDLRFSGRAFDYQSPFTEYLSVSPLASAMDAGTVLTPPDNYHVDNTTPGNPCGGRSLGLTMPPVSSVNFTYGNTVDASPVGDAFLQISSVSLGGVLNFGLWSPGTFTPGQTKTISVPGGFAHLAYVSGPTGATGPGGTAGQCGQAGAQLLLRAAPATRFQLTFTTC